LESIREIGKSQSKEYSQYAKANNHVARTTSVIHKRRYSQKRDRKPKRGEIPESVQEPATSSFPGKKNP